MSTMVHLQEAQRHDSPFWHNLPTSDELPDSDGKPVDNELHIIIPHLLKNILDECWSDSSDWFFGINMGIYHTTGLSLKIPIVPDAFLSLGVDGEKGKNGRGSYLVWEENNVVPKWVLEIVSKKYGNEYDEKMTDYAQLGVLYYVIYNPGYHKRLKRDRVEIYRLEQGKYVRLLGEPVWMPEIDLGIGHSIGIYQRRRYQWLFWYDAIGHRLKMPKEKIQQAQRDAEQAEQRAEQAEQEAKKERQQKKQAEQRAEKLAQMLREMGVDPNNLP